MKLRTSLIAAATAALVVAPAAAAHVEIQPDKVPADSDARLAIQVPTELEVPTVKVKLQLPLGLVEVNFVPKPGWTRKVTMQKLAKPITIEGEKITERVATVEWSGGKIEPGEFDEFVMSAHVPNTPGEELTFPALQTYANGKVVRWIEAPSGEFPAPRVTLEAAEGGTSTTASTTTTSTSSDNGDEHDELAIGLATAGLAAGLLALGLTLVRRRRA
jgi:uncharacterized protein YcnI